MKLSEAFPSQFLKWEDIDGAEPTVTISAAQMETLGDDHKLVLKFTGKQKRFVCNRTNANTLEQLYGSDTDEWLGKQITLFVVPVQFQGRMVNGLRVRAPGKPSTASKPKGVKSGGNERHEPPADDLNDEIPW
jgi:hypothetical protein